MEKLLTTFLLIFFTVCGFGASTDFDVIKTRVIKTLVKPDVNDDAIELLLNSLREDGTWPGIDYADVSSEGFQHSRHSGNMVALARAYNKRSSKFFKSKKVKNVVEAAIENWVNNDYICENWWLNQIGTPNNLVQVMLLIGDKLQNEG